MQSSPPSPPHGSKLSSPHDPGVCCVNSALELRLAHAPLNSTENRRHYPAAALEHCFPSHHVGRDRGGCGQPAGLARSASSATRRAPSSAWDESRNCHLVAKQHNRWAGINNPAAPPPPRKTFSQQHNILFTTCVYCARAFRYGHLDTLPDTTGHSGHPFIVTLACTRSPCRLS